jgi:2-keto-4-pentenoate hydratase/2-oxohepta-3-ene-1,7-dioic acid hydratase in catechol pathway
MRLCRFDRDRLGLVEGDAVRDVSAALETLPPCRWPLPAHDPLIAALDAVRRRVEALAPTAPARPLSSIRLESPVANPGKIIGAPVNYAKHFDESRADKGINFGTEIKTIAEYGLFLKAGSSLIGPSAGIALPFPERRHDHEGELAVIIGKGGRGIARGAAMAHVAGYCLGLDMTVRGTEDRSFRKSIDTYSVLGPHLVTADEIADPGNLDLKLLVNGEVRQHSNTRYLIFDIPRLIEYASSFYTLHPGDVIMTGTPEGVAAVQPGDTIRLEIERVGAMEVEVRRAA